MPANLCVFAILWLLLIGPVAELSKAGATVLHQGLNYSIDTWTPEEGLPQSSVIAMTQTRDGYLWLGTLNGLVRFDGVRFTVFNKGNSPGLPSNRITALYEDRDDDLWSARRMAR